MFLFQFQFHNLALNLKVVLGRQLCSTLKLNVKNNCSVSFNLVVIMYDMINVLTRILSKSQWSNQMRDVK